MALREIRLDSDPVLRKISKPVKNITDRTKILVEDMIETMYHANGVGLAAPQVGILRRIAVVDIYDDTGVKVLINPVITEKDGKSIDQEGCLSVPGYVGEVERPAHIKVEYTTIDGIETSMDAEGLLARAICHEIDHLDGILFVDKVIEEKTE